MPLESWRTLRRVVLLDRSPRLRVLSDDVQLPDGRVIEGYLRLETPEFVVIVPVNHSGEIGLIRSYKRGVEAIDIQPPAGIIEAGETPGAAAERELLEETGCVAAQWQELGAYVLGGNLGVSRAHLYLATGCRQVSEPMSGDLEEQEVLWLPSAEVRRRWMAAEFLQLSTAAALGLALSRLSLGPAA